MSPLTSKTIHNMNSISSACTNKLLMLTHPHYPDEKNEIYNEYGTRRSLYNPIDIWFSHPQTNELWFRLGRTGCRWLNANFYIFIISVCCEQFEYRPKADENTWKAFKNKTETRVVLAGIVNGHFTVHDILWWVSEGMELNCLRF